MGGVKLAKKAKNSATTPSANGARKSSKRAFSSGNSALSANSNWLAEGLSMHEMLDVRTLLAFRQLHDLAERDYGLLTTDYSDTITFGRRRMNSGCWLAQPDSCCSATKSGPMPSMRLLPTRSCKAGL